MACGCSGNNNNISNSKYRVKTSNGSIRVKKREPLTREQLLEITRQRLQNTNP